MYGLKTLSSILVLYVLEDDDGMIKDSTTHQASIYVSRYLFCDTCFSGPTASITRGVRVFRVFFRRVVYVVFCVNLLIS